MTPNGPRQTSLTGTANQQHGADRVVSPEAVLAVAPMGDMDPPCFTACSGLHARGEEGVALHDDVVGGPMTAETA